MKQNLKSLTTVLAFAWLILSLTSCRENSSTTAVAVQDKDCYPAVLSKLSQDGLIVVGEQMRWLNFESGCIEALADQGSLALKVKSLDERFLVVADADDQRRLLPLTAAFVASLRNGLGLQSVLEFTKKIPEADFFDTNLSATSFLSKVDGDLFLASINLGIDQDSNSFREPKLETSEDFKIHDTLFSTASEATIRANFLTTSLDNGQFQLRTIDRLNDEIVLQSAASESFQADDLQFLFKDDPKPYILSFCSERQTESCFSGVKRFDRQNLALDAVSFEFLPLGGRVYQPAIAFNNAEKSFLLKVTSYRTNSDELKIVRDPFGTPNIRSLYKTVDSDTKILSFRYIESEELLFILEQDSDVQSSLVLQRNGRVLFRWKLDESYQWLSQPI